MLVVILDHFDVHQLQLCRLVVYLLVSVVVDNRNVADVDVVDAVHAGYARGHDAGMDTAAGDAADVDVLELRGHLTLFLRIGGDGIGIAAGGTVDVVALEDDGLVFDVRHLDIGDI